MTVRELTDILSKCPPGAEVTVTAVLDNFDICAAITGPLKYAVQISKNEVEIFSEGQREPKEGNK